MVEETTTGQLTAEDIKRMEEDAQRASREEARKIVEETEKKVRQEIEQSNKMKELEEARIKQEEELKKLQQSHIDSINNLKAEFEQKLKNVEDARKSTLNTENPFRSMSKDQTSEELKRRLAKDKDYLNSVEEESRRALLKKFNNLPEEFGTI